MQSVFKSKAVVYCCCWILLMIGCGGGGGDGETDNRLPVANAGDDQTVSVSGSETLTVTLSGADSDSDGTIMTRQWAQTAGTAITLSSANSATTTFSVDATEQNYTFTYTVTDNDGATASDDINITVIINDTPTSDAGEDQSISISSGTRTVTLSGTDGDSDGEIVTRQWAQTAGSAITLSNASSATATFTVGATAQTYTFTYTVTDDDGATATDEVSVSVALNSLPVVDAGTYDIYSFSDSDSRTITLTGNATDSDGSIAAHQWEQTGGSNTLSLSGDTTESVSFTVPATTATYTFTYTATDDDGGQATDTTTIYVVGSIFSDAFDDGSAWTSRWTPVDGASGTDWFQSNEHLLQRSDITNFEESYHLGTYAYLSNPTSAEIPADYRFSVDITPSTNLTGSFQGNDVGIMFRYQNNNNYYRVSMSARYGFTRFEKRQGGVFTTLAVNSIGYIDNQTINMTVRLEGNTIVVWIDSVPVFAIVDSDAIVSGTIALYGQDRVLFDNVMITEPSTKPTVATATPLAYSVALTADDSDPLTVEAVVLNMPTGGNVGFVLDDQDEVSVFSSDSSGYYTTQYTAVADGDHDIMTVLRDADGQSVASDINSTVGVGGNYYVAIGDSITNGVGDDDNSNNESADGRIVARQGYEAVLADLLTDATGVPTIVFNEGIGGQLSSELASRIDSILERHPSANGYLLMIGTNDSGYGIELLIHAANVAAITEAIDDDAGKTVWLARMMPTYEENTSAGWNPTGNIPAYNTNCNEIADASTSDDTYLGPNFYQGLFVTDPSAVYNDHLHPNDSGYQLMAESWSAVLVP